MWFGSKSGAAALFPFITEFIARVEAAEAGQLNKDAAMTAMGELEPVLE